MENLPNYHTMIQEIMSIPPGKDIIYYIGFLGMYLNPAQDEFTSMCDVMQKNNNRVFYQRRLGSCLYEYIAKHPYNQ